MTAVQIGDTVRVTYEFIVTGITPEGYLTSDGAYMTTLTNRREKTWSKTVEVIDSPIRVGDTIVRKTIFDNPQPIEHVVISLNNEWAWVHIPSQNGDPFTVKVDSFKKKGS